jgi:dUTP pyrophosphatase
MGMARQILLGELGGMSSVSMAVTELEDGAAGSPGSPKIKVMKLHPAAQLPRYAHTGYFGDLAADVYAVEAVVIAGGATVAVPTGIAMEFPSTHGALVEDRSGLALRGLTTLAGVIDPGYRGELKVVVTNLNSGAIELKAGERVAQLRIVQRIEASFEEVTALGEAARGAGGFGSTGS